MNLSMLRSGNKVFAKVECIAGYTFKAAIAGEKSVLFEVHIASSAVLGSSFASEVVSP